MRESLQGSVRRGFPRQGLASCDTLCPLARPQKALGSKPPIEPWSAPTPTRTAGDRSGKPSARRPRGKSRMPNSELQVGRYHQKGLAAKQDRRLQSSAENFLLTSPLSRNLFKLPPLLSGSRVGRPFFEGTGVVAGGISPRSTQSLCRCIVDRTLAFDIRGGLVGGP